MNCPIWQFAALVGHGDAAQQRADPSIRLNRGLASAASLPPRRHRPPGSAGSETRSLITLGDQPPDATWREQHDGYSERAEQDQVPGDEVRQIALQQMAPTPAPSMVPMPPMKMT